MTTKRRRRAPAPPMQAPLPVGVIPLLDIKQAAAYLGFKGIRSMERHGPAIPRVNVAPAGSHKPAWRYRVEDLQLFVVTRLKNPYIPVAERGAAAPSPGVVRRRDTLSDGTGVSSKQSKSPP